MKDLVKSFGVSARTAAQARMNYWEIIADNLSKAGWSWGCVSALDSEGRTIWIADAHRGDGQCFVVRADEKLTAFLESAIGAELHAFPFPSRDGFPRDTLFQNFVYEQSLKRGRA